MSSPISVAPMMDYTHTHFRMFMRLLTRRTTLYTEMLTPNGVIHNHAKVLRKSPEQSPVVAQLGGSDPVMMAKAASICEEYGYDEINVNVGCPSKKVCNAFGVVLMKNSSLVADVVRAMRERVSVPVTVKCRLGVDDMDSYEELHNFVQVVGEHIGTFIVHARKGIIGLSTKDNRNIPPLKYEWVARLCRDFPDNRFTLNGGVSTLAAMDDAVRRIGGVMIGRAATRDPWLFSGVDSRYYDTPNIGLSRWEVLERYAAYVNDVVATSPWQERLTGLALVPVHLFARTPRGKTFGTHLTEYLRNARRSGVEGTASALDAYRYAIQDLDESVLHVKPT